MHGPIFEIVVSVLYEESSLQKCAFKFLVDTDKPFGCMENMNFLVIPKSLKVFKKNVAKIGLGFFKQYLECFCYNLQKNGTVQSKISIKSNFFKYLLLKQGRDTRYTAGLGLLLHRMNPSLYLMKILADVSAKELRWKS